MDEPTNDRLKMVTEHAEDLALLGSVCSSLVLLPLVSSETEDHIRERINIALMMHGIDAHHRFHGRLLDTLFDHFVIERWKLVQALVALGDNRESRGVSRTTCACMLCNSIAEADKIRKGEMEHKAGLENTMAPEIFAEFSEQNHHLLWRILQPGIRSGEKKLHESYLYVIDKGMARMCQMLEKIYNAFRPNRRTAQVAQVQGMLRSLGIDPSLVDIQVIDVDEFLK